MKNIDKILEYIRNVKVEEIDWSKLFGSYSCGIKIGEDIKNNNLLDLKVLKNIENEIEHQSTLWTITPFAMIFLIRQLEKDYGDKKEEYCYILEIYKLIAETLKFTKDKALEENSFDKLEVYEDMKDIFKTNLNLEDFEDEEEYIEVFFEEEMTDIRYNSVYYYTDLIVKDGKKILEKIKLKKIELKIVAMILLLSENGYICYLDWKCELEDFQMISEVMKKIGIDENICNIEDLNLDEDDNIEVWSKEFNKVFGKKDIFIGNINTSSDSYSIFPINKENFKKLKELGNRIGMKIDFLNYFKEKNMDKNWQEMYERNKNKFRCKVDLESYFTEKKIGEIEVDTLDIGKVNLPTGEILACDPLVELGEARTYIQKTPVGKFPVKICVVPSRDYGNRYACVKVEFNKNKPVVYELAVTGNEKEMDEAGEDEFYGFGVDAGMGCVADKKSQDEYSKYWKKLEEEEEADNPFDDIFDDLLIENAKKYPKYQRDYGDWANFIIPDTDLNIPVFASGWGDGDYPCYFGYNEKGELCGFYIHFIDIEREYSDED